MDANIQAQLIASLNTFNSLGIKDQIDFDKFYLYSIITHSTAIEGSTVTELENQMMFDDDIVPAGRNVTEQLMNLDLKKAYEETFNAFSNNIQITPNLLTNISAAVMKNTGAIYNTVLGSFDSSKGEIRLVNVSAGRGGKSYVDFKNVPTQLEQFCSWLNHARTGLSDNPIDIYELSFEAHYRLVSIHPWVDGNGRTCRLLMNALQYEKGLLPSILRKDDKPGYIKVLAKSQDEDNSEYFIDFMTERLIASLNQYSLDYKKTTGI